jgi:hypothetical protein
LRAFKLAGGALCRVLPVQFLDGEIQPRERVPFCRMATAVTLRAIPRRSDAAGGDSSRRAGR